MKYGRKVLQSAAVVALSAGWSAGAFAQDTPDASQGAAIGVGEIVVTARRTSESAQDVPISVTAISGDQIAELSMRDLLEIQRVTPGLFISSQATAGRVKIAIRGQTEADSRLTTDPSVGVYIDGVNIPRDYGLRSSFVDIAQVEVLRGPQGTLFGRNTTGGALNITTNQPSFDAGGYLDLLFGSYSNAQVTAVANIPFTEDVAALRVVWQRIARDGFGEDANGDDVSNDDVESGRVRFRLEPSDNLDIHLSADFAKQRNNGPSMILTRDNMLQAGNSATAALGAIARQLGLDPANANDRLTAYNAWRAVYDADQDDFHDFAGTTGQTDHIDLWGASANIGYDFGGVELRSITSYRELQRTTEQDLDLTPFNLLVTLLTTDQKSFTQEFQLSSMDGEGLDWQTGVYYSREEGNEFSASNANRPVRPDRASISDTDVVNESTAVYAQGIFHLTPTVRITGGLRYTEDVREITAHNRRDPAFAYPDPLATLAGQCFLLAPAQGGPVFPNCTYTPPAAEFDDFSYLLSADWRPTSDLMFYGSYARGYRAGGFTAQAASSVLASQVALDAAFTPYEPEYVDNLELGVKSDWFDNRLRVNAAVFHQDYQDVQAQIRDLVNGAPVTLIRNAAQATLYGVELEVSAAPTEHLDFYFTASHLNAAYDEFVALDAGNNPIDLSGSKFPVPEWTANVGGSFSIPVSVGELRLNVNYAWLDDVSFRYDSSAPETVTQEAYGLLDARLSWALPGSGLSIAVFGKNLTDEEYLLAATNLESSGYNVGFPGDPRVVGLQVRREF